MVRFMTMSGSWVWVKPAYVMEVISACDDSEEQLTRLLYADGTNRIVRGAPIPVMEALEAR